MIINGKDKILSQTKNLPNMSETIKTWFQDLTFKRITKSIVNFQAVETTTTITTKGVRQPFTAQQLKVKPEGQRAWRWETLHCLSDVVLNPDDIVEFNSIRYRVIEKKDYTEYGYIEYEIVQDFQ
jgi:hypothetical protein